MNFDNAGPQVAIQIDRQSLRVFSQADIDAGRVQAGVERESPPPPAIGNPPDGSPS